MEISKLRNKNFELNFFKVNNGSLRNYPNKSYDNHNINKFGLVNELNIINGTASLNSNSPSFSSSGTSTATSSLVLTPTNANGINSVKLLNNNNNTNNRNNEQTTSQIYKINGNLMNLNDSFIQIDYDNHRNIQNGQIKCSTSSEFKNETNNNGIMLNHANNKLQPKIISNQNGHSIANGFLNKYPRVRQNSMSKSKGLYLKLCHLTEF